MSYGQQKAEPTEKARYYIDWFNKMMTSRSGASGFRKSDERMYFADVDDNRSQFTNKQLKFIEKKYDIPISTKIAYPIIEQMLSFLTGAKPYPRLIAPNDAGGDFSKTYEKAHNGVWYESKSNLELTQALRDMLVTGSGYMHVRRNHFYGETTFNVRHEYLPWTDFFVDPASRKPDLSDAEMMCIATLMTKSRAEKEFGIKLTDDDCIGVGNLGIPAVEEDIVVPWITQTGGKGKAYDHTRYVWVRRFYEKKEANVYVNENGVVSDKRPVPTEAPNPRLTPLREEIATLEQELAAVEASTQALNQEVAAVEQSFTGSATPQQQMQPMMQGRAETQSSNAQRIQLKAQLQKLQIELAATPKTVPAYIFIPFESTEETIAYEVRKAKHKKIKNVLMVGDTVHEDVFMPIDEYPIIHFCFSHMRRPDKTYGMMHYIRDLNKAMNKFWALAIYDMQTNATRKILIEETAVINQKKMEEAWAMPNAFVVYKGDPTLPNGGAPTVVEPSPLNQAVAQLIGMLQQMCEYITGMFAIIQGNGDRSSAPDSAGGIQSAQTFGTQRMKLYARHVESSLELLTYVTVCYLQQYAPRDKVLKFLDDDHNEQEVKVMESPEDMRFKVRINMTSSLPTVRHMAAQILSMIIGQHSNPAVADMLTKYMLKASDIPDAEQMAKELDAVVQMQQQLQSANETIDTQGKQIKMLENQAYSAGLAKAQEKGEMTIQNEVELAKQQIQHETEGATGAGQETTVATEEDIF